MSVSISISNGRPIRQEETDRIERLKREQAEEDAKPEEMRTKPRLIFTRHV